MNEPLNNASFEYLLGNIIRDEISTSINNLLKLRT